MKGQNVLRLNQSTMVQALQEYLDKRRSVYAEKQTVLSVVYGDSVFNVTVEEVVPTVIPVQAHS